MMVQKYAGQPYSTPVGLETARRQWRLFPTPGLCFSGWQPPGGWI